MGNWVHIVNILVYTALNCLETKCNLITWFSVILLSYKAYINIGSRSFLLEHALLCCPWVHREYNSRDQPLPFLSLLGSQDWSRLSSIPILPCSLRPNHVPPSLPGSKSKPDMCNIYIDMTIKINCTKIRCIKQTRQLHIPSNTKYISPNSSSLHV